MKHRLDKLMAARRLAQSRSQAENLIRLSQVKVDGSLASKPGMMVDGQALIEVLASERYVSRAGLKLASVAKLLNLDFRGKLVLDVGSSTGGFTDYALQNGARAVVAVDVGTEQLHPSLRSDTRIELHEKTDIRDFVPKATPDLILIDVSFISLREILPHIAKNIAGRETEVVAMVKPQFEAGKNQVNKGVIKNETMRRQILSDFEAWAKQGFKVVDKRDSQVTGEKGNKERFYRLKPL